MPAAIAASSGSNCCVAPTWLSSAQTREQHQRDLAADVAQVQREQRADQHAERDRAADLPREPHEHVDAVARRRPPSATRANCIASENSTSATRSASDDHGQHQYRSAGRARRSR